MASFVWLLLTEPTYNQTHLAALAWRARILGQKALRNVSRFPSGVGAFCPRMTTFYFKQSEFCQQRPQCERGRRDLAEGAASRNRTPVLPRFLSAEVIHRSANVFCRPRRAGTPREGNSLSAAVPLP